MCSPQELEVEDDKDLILRAPVVIFNGSKSILVLSPGTHLDEVVELLFGVNYGSLVDGVYNAEIGVASLEKRLTVPVIYRNVPYRIF